MQSSIHNQPLAIVGIGCRFPGNAITPKALWKMLCEGKDGIIEVPKDRWNIKRFYDPNPAKPGKVYVKQGGFLQQPLDEFDALFFGISPREAETLDPQQRLLLEVAWEALEDAGLIASQLAGSNTGVFMGGFMMDHLTSQTNAFNRHLINTHSAVSFSQTLLSARLAYMLDLRGPCFTMDTACSSSLVAIHQASQAIWRGECNLALVGGVNVMYKQETPMTMAKGQFLAADGRSKSFDARGDGYGRGEGAGVVILKPLAQAQADGDLIYATVVATGINQDGRTDGITVPNPKAQAALITTVLKQANVSTDKLVYIEAHGTGTNIGDPYECQALGEALQKPAENPCWVGSLKANIGHLEAAAGIAGLIKAALCLNHKQIPPVANLQTPNPAIPFEELGLRLPRCVEVLPEHEEGVYAGVNSFGYGGTNAHALLHQFLPTTIKPQKTTQNFYFLPLSARSEKALQALAGRYAHFIAEENHNLGDICYSAATRREHHRYRLGLIAESREALQQQLTVFADGQGQHLLSAKSSTDLNQAVFVMTGMGPQWWAMGQELFQQEPVFKATVERCDEIFQSIAGWSILEEMQKTEQESKVSETQIAQPANFVLQVGLFELWRSKGFEPAAIVGHSVGDVSAAYTSGVLCLEDALAVSFHRSRLQKKLSGRGKMLAVGLSYHDAQELLTQYDEDKVSFAAINSPSSITLSGDSDILEKIAAELESKEIFNRFLRVELAYHSPIMTEIRDELLDSLKEIKPCLPTIPLYSTVTGKRVDSVLYDGEYWYQNMRQPVLFADAMGALVEEGHKLFLEIGPHPVLGASIKEVLNHVKVRGQVVTSLKRAQPESLTFYQALAELFCLGLVSNWQKFYPEGGQFVRLPLYPWQRERYWLESEASLFDRLGDDNDHSLLGHRQNTPLPTWHQPLNTQYLPWLPDHQVQGLVILPGAAYIECALQLQSLVNTTVSCVIENIGFQRALVIDDLDEPVLRSEYDNNTRQFRIYSCAYNGKHWLLHAQGYLSTLPPTPQKALSLDSLRLQCQKSIAVEVLYARLANRNLHYGTAFRPIQQVFRGEDQILVKIQAQTSVNSYALHPTLLDAAFQSLIGIVDADDERSFIPVALGRMDFYKTPDENLWAYSQIKQRNANSITADICLCNDNGELLVVIKDLRCQALASGTQRRSIDNWFYQVVWELKALEGKLALNTGWLLFMDSKGVAEASLVKLQQAGEQRIVKVYVGDEFRQLDSNSFSIRPQHQDDMIRLMTEVKSYELQNMLFAWSLDLDAGLNVDGTLMATTLLHCAQTYMSAVPNKDLVRLFVLSSGAQSLAKEPVINAAQATVVGLTRVITSEYTINCRTIDIDDCQNAQTLDLLAEELLINDEEREIAFYQGQRFAYRLQHWQNPRQQLTIPLTGNDAFSLQQDQKQFYWQQVGRTSLAENELELHIDYAVLSPGFNVGQESLMPIYGQVSRSNHKGYKENQSVIALVPITSLSSYSKVVVADDVCILNVPKTSLFNGITRALTKNTQPSIPEEVFYAASLLDFARAWYALEHIAQLRSDDAVLIHASEDNSDLAAVQIALIKTKKVVATYRTTQKHQALTELGITQCFSLTGEDCLQRIAEANPLGFDVIINHLNGEKAEKTLTLAKPFAKVFMNTLSDLHHFENIQLIALDMSQLAQQQPSIYQQLLQQILTAFSKSLLQPFAVEVLSANQFEQALALYKEQKIALKIGASHSITAKARKDNGLNLTAGSYLITGAFGGFGLKLALWLAKKGVKHLVLVGRSGAASSEAKETLALLHDAGVQVMEVKVDISDGNQVADLIAKVQQEFPALVGIFHTAAVLDDAMLVDLTAERLAGVMAPKALGGWHLHHHTETLNLEYFVLFSSISSILGKPGQSNYVAANNYLDQLAHYRQAKGLKALSINWGVLAEVGMAARQGMDERLKQIGIDSFTADEAMQMLSIALNAPDAQLGLMHIDWQAFLYSNSNRIITLRYQHLLDSQWLAVESPLQSFYKELKAKNNNQEQQSYIIGLLVDLIANIMRLPVKSLDTDVPLNNFGLDSLMAVEIQGVIERGTGVSLSVLKIMQDNSIEQLADDLLVHLETQL